MAEGMSLAMVIICLVAALNCATIGYDSSMSAFKEKFGFTSNLEGLLTASQNLGSIVACFFVGSFIDKFGRKEGILTSACLVLVACILHSTATTQTQFFVGRIVVGVAKAVDIAAVPTYLVELAPPARRGFVAGLYWTCWLLGAIISSGIGYGARSVAGDWSWRLICICMAGPALSCILALPFVPESPRWLISKGRDAKALRVLARFHGAGDQTNPLGLVESVLGRQVNKMRGCILVTLAVFEQTMGSSIITFYLSNVLDLAGITSESEQFAINLGQNCVAFVAALIGISILDRVGRVPMLIGGTVFCAAILATMAGLTAAQTDNEAGRNGIIAMVFLFQAAYSCSWTPISFSYCAEVLNFTIRAKGMAFFNIIDSSAGFFSQYVIPIGLDGIGWRFYIAGVVWNIFAAVLVGFTYVETAGLTLEQIDQRMRGVPRSELLDVIEAYDGMQPVSDKEMNDISKSQTQR